MNHELFKENHKLFMIILQGVSFTLLGFFTDCVTSIKTNGINIKYFYTKTDSKSYEICSE